MKFYFTSKFNFSLLHAVPSPGRQEEKKPVQSL